MSFGVASSADLVSWKLESYDILPEMHDPANRFPATKFAWFMPTITYSPKSGRYALWYYVDANARGVAVSDSPVGPFKIVHDSVPNLQLGSDFFFWTGSDGEVYMKHNGGCGQGIVPPKRGSGICVARLAHNLTDIAGDPSHCTWDVERRGEFGTLGSLAGCFLALGSGLGLVGTASARR